jgi:hypothetical protein
MMHVLTLVGIAVGGILLGLLIAFLIAVHTFKDMWGRM